MPQTSTTRNSLPGKWAPLRNLTLMDELVETLKTRPSHAPGLGVFHGPSGFGKSYACARASVDHQAFYVEAKSMWSPRTMMAAILKEMGLPVKRSATIHEMVEQAAEELEASRRPLLIDESDHVVARGLVELVRDLHDAASPVAVIVLVGEEGLPHKLKPYERVHGRVRKWVAAQPCNLEDARALAELYCPRVTVDDDLLAHLVQMVGGSTRRIAVNLEEFATFAFGEGMKTLTLKDWGNREIYTGAPPAVRRFA
ncbi:AAA family ATPase [Roseomonas genomospecies 6]|uniref:ATP-binding protein n=1 Tax=Roseomonas genomospecies 6 TaxID=214106 RepID=A0A9W7KR24_9PROT|nr:ATP-binding protein [Roseomonas genomospecies 6]KAA0678110.1 ATP-binding protein [Roseomonas genomospecies 6]